LSGPVIPISLKIAYTLFVCLLVPIYWRQHGLVNSPVGVYQPTHLLLERIFG
jgi:hypothetical protein